MIEREMEALVYRQQAEIARLRTSLETMAAEIVAANSAIARLTRERDALRVMLRECADDLRCEVEGRYQGVKDHPAMRPKYERDIDSANRADLFLNSRDVTDEQRAQSETCKHGTPKHLICPSCALREYQERQF